MLSFYSKIANIDLAIKLIMTYAPIALFTYNRADKTQRVVESLLQNVEAKDSELFIFSDGPKTEAKKTGVEENRKFIHTIKGFKSITIVEREKNWGLANSLIAGITDVINRYGRVIVVEDDLILSPYFLKFMNDGLEKYKDDDRVTSISGFIPKVDEELPETFFLRFFHCWGWATWDRAWKLLNNDVKYLLRKLRFKTYDFGLDGSIGSYGILYCQKIGLVDSWYIRLYASFYLNGKLTLFPGKTMVRNGGLDGSGTHCDMIEDSTCLVQVGMKPIPCHDIVVKENVDARKCIASSFRKNLPRQNYWLARYLRIKSFIRRLCYIDCV